MSLNKKEILIITVLTSAILLLGFLFYESKICAHQIGKGFPIPFYTGEHLVPGNGGIPDEIPSFSALVFIMDLMISLIISILTIKGIKLFKE